MPTYEYICEACERTFERFQSMTEEPLRDCPFEECGAKGRVRRLIGPGAGIIFKGSGFYATDYKKSGGSASGTANSTKPTPPCKTEGGTCPCADAKSD